MKSEELKNRVLTPVIIFSIIYFFKRKIKDYREEKNNCELEERDILSPDEYFIYISALMAFQKCGREIIELLSHL